METIQFPKTSVRVKGLKAEFPIFDMRDGKEHEGLQMKTPTQFIRGLVWNGYKDRSTTGIHSDHDQWIIRKVKEARKVGEEILFASLHNYGVSIGVKA